MESKKIAISIKNLSKSYTINSVDNNRRYVSIREVIYSMLSYYSARIFKGKILKQGNKKEKFWALKNINIDIHHGDRWGIIGRNGAGKSTLLKILSRITAPTEGQVLINGRVASLLEVGTGFHPELTGRENIFLNGAILGMSRIEIVAKFDEIVAFAGVESFIDTPVKRYSSGMYMRLAFAVAAHLDPDILIVDEVLAVGDVAFQKKCLQKMNDISSAGVTLIFVSHDLPAVMSLCNKAIYLRGGEIKTAGNVEEIALAYAGESMEQGDLSTRKDRTGHGLAKAINFRIRDVMGCEIKTIISRESIYFDLDLIFDKTQIGRDLTIIYVISDVLDVRLMSLNSNWAEKKLLVSDISQIYSCFMPEGLALVPGSYMLTIAVLVDDEKSDKIERAVELIVNNNSNFLEGLATDKNLGSVTINQVWKEKR